MLRAPGEYPRHDLVGEFGKSYTAFPEEFQVGFRHLLEVHIEKTRVHLEDLQQLVDGAENWDPKFKIAAQRAAAEVGLRDQGEADDLGARQTEFVEFGNTGSQGFLDVSVEPDRVVRDGGGDVSAGEAKAGEEGEDGLGSRGGLEVSDPLRGLECLGLGEAAAGDEVALNGGGACDGGEETVEREG